ncbi:MAG: sugar ABC transporter substrate-binding protein [Clostridia bacterium]|nr:sugar ABC transporter substrate-binding protein [Clostridia bacterium]
MIKKIVSCLIAAVMFLGVSACGPSPSPDEEIREVNLYPDKGTVAEISILIPGGNSNERTMVEALIEDFNMEYPNVSIEYNYISVSNYESTIRNLASSGTLDDIVWSNSPDFYYLVDKKLVYDLNPYVEASKEAGIFDLQEDFFHEFFGMGSLGGKLYCVPRSADTVITFINTEIFNNAGVDMSLVKNGWTWDTFLSVCEQIRTYFDNNGMADRYVLDANLDVWLAVCYPMLRSYGAEVIDENGNVAIDSAATRECVAMVREMVRKRYIVDSQMASGSSYEAGTSAMLFQSSSVSHYAERLALKGKVDVVSFPLIDIKNTPKIGCGIAGYCISKTTKHPDICWAFLNYMISYDGQQKMALNGLNLASVRKDLSDPTVANWGKEYPTLNMAAYLFGSEYKIDTSFLSRIDSSMKTGVSTAVQDMFHSATNSTKDLEKAVRDCYNQILDELEDY